VATTRMVGRVSVRVMPDSRRFRPDLLKDLEKLERSLSVSIPTRIDTKKVAADAARVKADVERQLGSVRVGVNVDSGKAAAQLAAATRDRDVDIEPRIDRAALARVRTALAGIAGAGARLTGGAAGIGALAGAFSTLAAGAAAAVVPVLQLGTALAPAVGILATLPAAAGTAAAAVAPLVIAFQGMGEALGAALTGDTEALAAAMEDLTPAAQGVVRAVSDLAPGLSRVRDMVQEGFFRPLVEPVERLGETLLPVLGRGLTRVSMALGESTAGLVDFIGEARNMRGLDLLFASTARSVENASGVLPGLLTGLRELGIVGLPFIEQAAQAATDASEGFAQWATHAAESGRATEWIEDAIDTFRQLGTIAENVGGIIGSVFSAAGDGGILGTIEELTGALDDFFASAEGGAALQGVFEGLADVGGALAPVLTSLAGGIGSLSPMIGRLATAFGPILTTAIDGLVPALLELEPGLMAVLDGLGEGVSALVDSGALTSMGTAFSAVLTAVSPLLPVLGELAGVLAGALAEALIALAPSLELIATELAEQLAPILPELAESFGALVEAVAPLIPPLVEELLPVLGLLPELLGFFAAQMGTVAEMITLAQPALEGLIESLGFFVDIGTTVLGFVLQLATAIWSMSDEVYKAGLIVGTTFLTMRDRVVSYLVNLAARARTIVTGIRVFLTSTFSAARAQVVAAFQAMVSGARTRLSTMVSAVARIPGLIRTAVGSLGGLLRQAGRNVIQGLINGVRSKLGELRSQMASVASTVRGALPFSPAKYGPLKTHPPDVAGETITRMIADGLERGRRIVASAAGDVAGAAVLDVDSQPLAATSDGPAPVVIDGRGLDRALREWLTRSVRVDGRGNVQLALGPGRG